MKRNAAAAIAALSLVIVLSAAGVAAYRILSADAAGRRTARAEAERLSAILAPVRAAADLADPGLRGRLAEYYRRSPSLLLAAVYERGAGIRWSMPARSSYLGTADTFTALPTANYPSRSAILVRSPLTGDPTGRLAFDALFVTLSQATVFAAIRDSTIALASWLLILLAILLAARLGRGEADTAWRTAGPAPAGSGAFPREGAEGVQAPAAPWSPGAGAGDEEFEVPELNIDIGAGGEEIAEEAVPGEDDFVEEGMEEASPAPVAPAKTGGGTDRSMPRPAGEKEPRGLYSPRSGLGWEEYLADRLSAELSRSASFEQDLALVVLAVDDWKEEPEAHATVSRAVRDFWSFKDLAFERGDFGFAVVLPNMDLEHALRMAEEFLKKLTFLLADRQGPLDYLPVFMGISTRAGRLVDASRLAQEADAALEKAREERDSHIVAFKPDPDKYRIFLASKGC